MCMQAQFTAQCTLALLNTQTRATLDLPITRCTHALYPVNTTTGRHLVAVCAHTYQYKWQCLPTLDHGRGVHRHYYKHPFARTHSTPLQTWIRRLESCSSCQRWE